MSEIKYILALLYLTMAYTYLVVFVSLLLGFELPPKRKSEFALRNILLFAIPALAFYVLWCLVLGV